MNLTNKLITGGVIGAGAIAVIAYVNNLKRAQADLQVVPTAAIHKLSLQGLTIRVDALLKNPTAASFKIKYPLIELSHASQLIGSSQVVNKDIKIPSYGQVLIKDIYVDVPILSFFTVSYDIIKALMNKQAIKFTVAVVTTLDLGWMQKAYEHKQDITLKK